MKLTILATKLWLGATNSLNTKSKEGELGALVVSTCAGAFRTVMSRVPSERLEALSEEDWDIDDESQMQQLREEQALVERVCEKMGHLCAEKLLNWGAEIRGLNLKQDSPHPYRSIPIGHAALGAVIGPNGSGNINAPSAVA